MAPPDFKPGCEPDNFDFTYKPEEDDDVKKALPGMEEVPATELERCKINCALLAKKQAEDCIKLRKQVSLWLEKQGCPTILKAVKSKKGCGSISLGKKYFEPKQPPAPCQGGLCPL